MTPNEKKECIKLLYLDGVISLSEFLALCGYTEEEIRQMIAMAKKKGIKKGIIGGN